MAVKGKGVEVGTAYVRIIPRLEANFKNKVFEGLGAGQAGEKAGRDFTKGVEDGVKRSSKNVGGKAFADAARRADVDGKSAGRNFLNGIKDGVRQGWDDRSLFRRVKDSANREGEVVGDKFSNGLSGSLGKVKSLAGGLFAGVAISNAAKGFNDLTNLASDYNETLSKSNTVWGANAKAVEAWANDSVKNLGLSKAEALDATASYGNMFQQIGIAGDKTLKMSKDYMTAAADLGSFHNASTQEVTEALMSAQRGEYDSLQQFIPTINAAKVEEQALAETHKKSAKELTDAEKAMATHTLVMKGMGAAAGDWAKTNGQMAGSQKQLNAQIVNLKTEMGKALLPIKAFLVFGASQLLMWAQRQGPAFAKVKTALAPLGKAFGVVKDAASAFFKVFQGKSDGKMGALSPGMYKSVSEAARKMRDVWNGLADVFKTKVVPVLASLWGVLSDVGGWLFDHKSVIVDVGKDIVVVGGSILGVVFAARKVIDTFKALRLAVASVKAGFMAVRVLMAANPFGLAVIGITALAVGLMQAYKRSETFRNIVNGAFNAVKVTVSAVVGWFTQTALPGIASFFKGAGDKAKAFGQGVSAVWNGVKLVTSLVWNGIKVYFTTLFNVYRVLFTAAFNAIKTIVVTVWNVIKGVTTAVWNGIKSFLSSVFNAIKGVVSSATASLKGTVSAAWNWISGTTSRVWGGISGFFSRFWASLSGSFTRVTNTLKSTIGGAWDAVHRKTTDVWGKIGGFFDRTFASLKSKFDTVVRNISKAWDGLRGAFARPINAVVGYLNSPLLSGAAKIASKVPGMDWAKGLSIPKIPGFRRGGQIPGTPAIGYDDRWALIDGQEPIRVGSGEYIVNAEETRRSKPLLDALNFGGLDAMLDRLTGFFRGGVPSDRSGSPGGVRAFKEGGFLDTLKNAGNNVLRGITGQPALSGRAAKAIAFAESQIRAGSRAWGHLCQKFVNTATGYPFGRFGSARAQMNALRSRGLLRMTMNPPAGAQVYYETGKPAGHVALADGRGNVYSNDVGVYGSISKIGLGALAKRWNSPFSGWADSFGGGGTGLMASFAGMFGSLISQMVPGLGPALSKIVDGSSDPLGAAMKWVADLFDPWKKESDAGHKALPGEGVQSIFKGIAGQANTKSQDKVSGFLQGIIGKISDAVAGSGFVDQSTGQEKPGATGTQVSNARIIAQVGQRMGFGRNGIKVALMTALQESGLKNISHGDRDSVGLFQQRPSMGWGSVNQILNPSYSAGKFFGALRGVRGWERMAPTVAAQRVQRSAFPSAYAKWDSKAESILRAMGLATGGMVPKPTLYDTGGVLKPGTHLIENKTGKPEYILNAQDTERLLGGGGKGGAMVNIEKIETHDSTEVVDELNFWVEHAQFSRSSRFAAANV